MHLMWIWMLGLAHAECPALPGQLDAAWEAFDDAEVPEARELLDQAVGTLPCQAAVVDNQVLLDLFRLHALVALALEDKEGAVFWTIRTVGANPRADPPANLGPDLGALYETWSERLLQATVQVSVKGGGTVYIDGRPVTAYTPLTVVEGQHLVQVERPDGLSTGTQELTADVEIATGLPDEPPPPGWKPPEPEPEPDPDPVPVDRPPMLLISGAVVTVAGLGGLGYGGALERGFKNTDFKDRDLLLSEARRVRNAYSVGYGLAGVGVVLTAAGVVLAPGGARISTDGATFRVSLTW